MSKQYRHFAAPENRVAKEWIKAPVSEAIWTLAGAVGQGEAQSLHADSKCGLRGIAKPDDRGGAAPRAAHEKIASDLAYHLDFPVPPVTLWTDPDTGKQYSVSLFAFKQTLTWDQAAAVRTPEFMAKVAPALAACYVFHNWIGDQDHSNNGGNTLIDGGGSVDPPGIAAIDHAYSMTFSWNSSPPPFSPMTGYLMPPSELPRDDVLEAVARVQQLPEELIRKIVERVPEVYLSSERRSLIIECLLQRQGELVSLGK